MTIAINNHTEITIDGVTEPTIIGYFRSLNAGDFVATSALFAPDGMMMPPFEDEIKGRDAILSYLTTEAEGLNAQPRRGTMAILEDGAIEYCINGRVQTSLFGVNVAWTFLLNAEKAISQVEVKLLASPQELLNLRLFN